MVIARLMGMALVALSIVFVCLWFYARAAKREKLEEEWDKDQGPGRRESFVKAELMAYEGPLKRKLIWGVYVIPGTLLAVLIYVTNMG
ncbi:MAG: hypothetical protein V2I76_15735 [Roseobacter sp.]|jgi:hypothetical protein|nr:hypothetical protein [Roseobacter sp.]